MPPPLTSGSVCPMAKRRRRAVAVASSRGFVGTRPAETSRERLWRDIEAAVQERRLRVRGAAGPADSELLDDCVKLATSLIGKYQAEVIAGASDGERIGNDDKEWILFKVAALFGTGQLEPFLSRADVENVYCFGPHRVVLGLSNGQRVVVEEPVFEDADEMVKYISHLASTHGLTGRRFDKQEPMLDLRLRSGERIFAAHEVCNEPFLTVRCHRLRVVTLDSLVQRGTLTRRAADFVSAAVRRPMPANILVAGALGCGKTTLLRALLAEIDEDEFVCTLEQTFELFLGDRHPNTYAVETREPNSDGTGEVTMEELSKRSLRSSVDRVIVGELRGAEAMQFLSACGTGSDGSMATIHASNAQQALSRLVRYCLKDPQAAGTQTPLEEEVMEVIHLVVHLRQAIGGHRYVHSISEVLPNAEGRPSVVDIFLRRTEAEELTYVAPPSGVELTERIAATGLDVDTWRLPA